jgi:DNA adenine methylase
MSTSVIGYYGSKVRVAPRIVDLLPEHHGYVEPFCGSLAVLLAKPAARFEVVNDLDGDLMTFWRMLRERTDDLQRLCALTPHSRGEYEASWPIEDDPDDLERARRVWVKLTQGRAGSLRSTGWRYHEAPLGRSSSMPRTLAGYVGRFALVADRLSTVTLECRPALEVIAAYGRDPHNLLYVDPPYLASTRSGTAYRHEMPDDQAHRDLAAALTECKATVVLSGYPSALYRELYDGWDRAEIAASTGQGNTWSERTEVIWCNRQLRRDQPLDFGEPA